MAKSKSFFGLRRGSTKTLTFQVNNGQQITKDRVSVVKNPKTANQAQQRMLLKPAAVFYNAFSDVLDHSFQGISYGQDARNKFMSLAMGGNRAGTPFVVKGRETLVPGRYIVSTGSLMPITPELVASAVNPAVYEFTTPLNAAPATATTRAAVVQALVDGNPGVLQLNDKITFLVVCKNAQGFYYGRKMQVILSTKPTSEVGDDYDDLEIVGASLIAYNGQPFVYVAATDDSEVVAAAVILSRGNDIPGALRSTSQMAILPSEAEIFYGSGAFMLAVASYQEGENGSTLSENWYLNYLASGKVGRIITDHVTVNGQDVEYIRLVIEQAGILQSFVFVDANDILVAPDGYVAMIGDDEVTLYMAGLPGEPTLAWGEEYRDQLNLPQYAPPRAAEEGGEENPSKASL